MPSPSEQWPKEIVFCLECGKTSNGNTGFGGLCNGNAVHGPTQKISVVPEDSLREVRDALEAQASEFERYAAIALRPDSSQIWRHAANDVRAALQKANEVLGGDGP